MTRSTGLVLSGGGVLAMIVCGQMSTSPQALRIICDILAGLNAVMFGLWLIKPWMEVLR